MPDLFDQAQAREEEHRSDALAAVLRRMHEEPPNVDLKPRACMDCDAPIPRERLALVPNAARCFSCQEDDERASGGA